jgi:hypothetical protein
VVAWNAGSGKDVDKTLAAILKLRYGSFCRVFATGKRGSFSMRDEYEPAPRRADMRPFRRGQAPDIGHGELMRRAANSVSGANEQPSALSRFERRYGSGLFGS